MPQETAKITFYKVTECGFFQRGAEEADFGNIGDTLSHLEAWSEGKQLVETKTYEPSEASELMPCYLLNITSAAGSWLVTMWNETPSTDGQTASAMGTSSVGNAEIIMNELPEGGIPGFATYFWFLPEEGVFASIRFQHLITGQKPMQLYMESYLSEYSPYVVRTEPEDGVDIELIGYKKNEDDDAANLLPRFRTCLFKKPGNLDLLRSRAHDIRKVLRKTSLRISRPEERAHWQRLLTNLNLRQAQPNDEAIKVRYEIGANLTGEELNKVIRDWSRQHERQWDDYGFKLKGDRTIHWLSHSIARDEFQVDATRDNAEVVNATTLLRELNRKKPSITGLLD